MAGVSKYQLEPVEALAGAALFQTLKRATFNSKNKTAVTGLCIGH